MLRRLPLALAAGFSILATAVPGRAEATKTRGLLSADRTVDWVREHLVPQPRFRPYPTCDDRAAWEGLPEATRTAYVKAGESALTEKWEPLPATLFLEFARNGNRSRYEGVRRARRDRLQALTLAECVEAKARFLDATADGVWLVAEETFWGVPAHLSAQAKGYGLPDVEDPIIDLFAAETGAQLAWTLHLLGDRLDAVSPLLRPRLVLEIDRRVLAPFLARDDFWWMGADPARHLNNWTPWITSNVLTSALLVETDPARRAALVHKSLRVLDRFVDQYPADGGCDEGPGYWNANGGALFQSLELLHDATGGAIDVFGDPLIQDIGRFIYRAHIGGEWMLNYGDASARSSIDGPLVYRFGTRVGDPVLAGFGAWAMGEAGEGVPSGTFGRLLPALFATRVAAGIDARPPLVRDVWLPELQLMAARDRGGSDQGLFVGVHGGHNAESHNHNDVGSAIVAVDGHPTLIDVGVETYTRKTFSSDRYDIWTMQSAFHNLPTINGAMQAAGRERAARDVRYVADDASASLSLDLAEAYPDEAKVQSWQRAYRLTRGRGLDIVDTYTLREASGPLVLNFMTACDVAVSPGRLLVRGGDSPAAAGNPGLVLTYDPRALQAKVDPVDTEDSRLKRVWGPRIFRIQLVARKPVRRGTFTVRITRAGP